MTDETGDGADAGETLEDLVHDALVELNQLRVAMHMDPVEGLVRPKPEPVDEVPADHEPGGTV